MPNAKGHFYGGICFHTIFVLLFSKSFVAPCLIQNFFFGLPFVIFGALLPDADINSYGQKLLFFITVCSVSLAIAFQAYHLAFYSGLLLLLGHLSKHRGIMHNPIFLIVVSTLFIGLCKMPQYKFFGINKLAYLSFLNGALSHIVLDLLQTRIKKMIRGKAKKIKK